MKKRALALGLSVVIAVTSVFGSGTVALATDDILLDTDECCEEEHFHEEHLQEDWEAAGTLEDAEDPGTGEDAGDLPEEGWDDLILEDEDGNILETEPATEAEEEETETEEEPLIIEETEVEQAEELLAGEASGITIQSFEASDISLASGFGGIRDGHFALTLNREDVTETPFSWDMWVVDIPDWNFSGNIFNTRIDSMDVTAYIGFLDSQGNLMDFPFYKGNIIVPGTYGLKAWIEGDLETTATTTIDIRIPEVAPLGEATNIPLGEARMFEYTAEEAGDMLFQAAGEGEVNAALYQKTDDGYRYLSGGRYSSSVRISETTEAGAVYCLAVEPDLNCWSDWNGTVTVTKKKTVTGITAEKTEYSFEEAVDPGMSIVVEYADGSRETISDWPIEGGDYDSIGKYYVWYRMACTENGDEIEMGVLSGDTRVAYPLSYGRATPGNYQLKFWMNGEDTDYSQPLTIQEPEVQSQMTVGTTLPLTGMDGKNVILSVNAEQSGTMVCGLTGSMRMSMYQKIGDTYYQDSDISSGDAVLKEVLAGENYLLLLMKDVEEWEWSGEVRTLWKKEITGVSIDDLTVSSDQAEQYFGTIPVTAVYGDESQELINHWNCQYDYDEESENDFAASYSCKTANGDELKLRALVDGSQVPFPLANGNPVVPGTYTLEVSVNGTQITDSAELVITERSSKVISLSVQDTKVSLAVSDGSRFGGFKVSVETEEGVESPEWLDEGSTLSRWIESAEDTLYLAITDSEGNQIDFPFAEGRSIAPGTYELKAWMEQDPEKTAAASLEITKPESGILGEETTITQSEHRMFEYTAEEDGTVFFQGTGEGGYNVTLYRKKGDAYEYITRYCDYDNWKLESNVVAGETYCMAVAAYDTESWTGTAEITPRKVIEAVSIENQEFSLNKVHEEGRMIPVTVTYGDGSTEIIREWEDICEDEDSEDGTISYLKAVTGYGYEITLRAMEGDTQVEFPVSYSKMIAGSYTFRVSVSETDIADSASVAVKGIEADTQMEIGRAYPVTVKPGEADVFEVNVSQAGNLIFKATGDEGSKISLYKKTGNTYVQDETVYEGYPLLKNVESGEIYYLFVSTYYDEDYTWNGEAKVSWKKELSSFVIEDMNLTFNQTSKYYERIPVTVIYEDGSEETVSKWGMIFGYDEETEDDFVYALTQRTANGDELILQALSDGNQVHFPMTSMNGSVPGTYTLEVYEAGTDLSARSTLIIGEQLCPNGHTWDEGTVTKPVTCTENGIRKYTCSVCQEERTETILATGHTDGGWKVTKEASCVEVGEKAQICGVCGAVLNTEIIWSLGHTAGEWETSKEPSCVNEGEKVQRCSVCKAVLDTESIPALGHTAGEWKTTKEPTCANEGEKVQYCSICQEVLEKESIPTLEHTEGEWKTTKEPTCANEGEKVQYCSTCGEVIKTESIPTLEHTEGEWKVELEPACTEAGRRVQICSVCGGVIRTEEIEAVGHTLGEWVVEYPPTCTEEGMQHKYCIKCGAYQFSMYPPATGHDEEWVIITPATCTETGERKLVCKVCEEVLQTEEIPAMGHNGEWEITTPATCTETGERELVCSLCGEVLQTEEIPATGHNGEWEITTPATCTEIGEKELICGLCGEVLQTEEIPATGHDEGEWQITTPATCTETGEKELICGLCGEVLQTEEIPATGHDGGQWKITKPATCVAAGTKILVCGTCRETLQTATIPATGKHTAGAWKVTRAATCGAAGTKVQTCTVCGKVLKTETIPATGKHTAGSWKITRAATCGATGTRVQTCKVCGKTLKTETIPATGKHTYGAWKVTRAATALATGIKTRTCTKCGHKETASIAKLKPTITVNVKTLPMKVGQTSTAVKVSGLAKGDYVKSWKSSNTAIVKVDSKGKLTAQKKTGTATITITLASKKTATVKVTVQKGMVRTTSVSVTPKNFTLQKGKSKKLTWVIYPLTSQEKVTFTTSNKKVATVSSTGNVSAKGKGTAKITVKSGSKTAVVTVTVK